MNVRLANVEILMKRMFWCPH